MKKILIFSLIVIAIILAVFFASSNKTDQSTETNSNTSQGGEHQMPKNVVVPIEPINSSGFTGQAIFAELDQETTVGIQLAPNTSVVRPAAIRAGTCSEPGSLKFNLENLVNGRSETTIAATNHSLHLSGALVLLIGKSQSEPENYIACGRVSTVMLEAMNSNAQSQKENQTPGVYKDYSPDVLAQAQQSGQKVVLFFHAAWCPFCRAAEAEITSNLGKIPSGVTVLKVDYDKERELKTKYAITYQHTFVQVDGLENQVTKWTGGGINELTTNIK